MLLSPPHPTLDVAPWNKFNYLSTTIQYTQPGHLLCHAKLRSFRALSHEPVRIYEFALSPCRPGDCTRPVDNLRLRRSRASVLERKDYLLQGCTKYAEKRIGLPAEGVLPLPVTLSVETPALLEDCLLACKGANRVLPLFAAKGWYEHQRFGASAPASRSGQKVWCRGQLCPGCRAVGAARRGIADRLLRDTLASSTMCCQIV